MEETQACLCVCVVTCWWMCLHVHADAHACFVRMIVEVRDQLQLSSSCLYSKNFTGWTISPVFWINLFILYFPVNKMDTDLSVQGLAIVGQAGWVHGNKSTRCELYHRPDLKQEQRVNVVSYSQGTCKGHVNKLVMHAWQGWRGNFASGFHVLLDLSLGIDQDILEMVVRDKLILIISSPGKHPGPSQSRTPTVKVLEVWTTFAHECMQQDGTLRS